MSSHIFIPEVRFQSPQEAIGRELLALFVGVRLKNLGQGLRTRSECRNAIGVDETHLELIGAKIAQLHVMLCVAYNVRVLYIVSLVVSAPSRLR